MHKVAVVGAGIGAEHLRGYTALPDHFKVTTLCDLDQSRAQPLADEFGTDLVSDFDTVLADTDTDIVDICLPPHLHFVTCMQALEAGKHVVCEKPLVSSLAEADALIAKSQETGKMVFPVFQYRFGLGTAQMRALMQAGLAGKCYAGTLETHWDRPASYYATDWRGTWAGEQGGAILGHAIHIHDLLPSVLGPIAKVYADVATRVNDIEVEDCAAITLRMEDGALITSSVTLGTAGNISRMRLMFEGFTVESDHAPYAPAAAGWTFTAREPTKQADIDTVLANVDSVPIGYPGMFLAMAEALADHPGREVNLQDGRRSLEFVTAVYASARSNLPVDLPIGPDHPMYDGWLP